MGERYTASLEDRIDELKAEQASERALLDDLAAFLRGPAGSFITDPATGSAFYAARLRDLLARHDAVKATR